MATVTICSDFEAEEEKICQASTFSPSIYHEVASPDREGNGNPLQYSCLENPMGGGAWQAIVHRVPKEWDVA